MPRRKPLTLSLIIFLLIGFPDVADAELLRTKDSVQNKVAPLPPPKPPVPMAESSSPVLPAPAAEQLPVLPIPAAPPFSTPQISTGVVDYFPVLTTGNAADMPPEFVPIVSNSGLDGDHTALTDAIIFVHDDARNAQAAVSVLSALAGDANTHSLIVAPQFLLDSDIALHAEKLPQKGRMFSRWALGTWDRGDDAVAMNGARGVSSFSVIDLMLMYLTDKKSFPALNNIVLAGMGAGGSFVQRYAAVGRGADILAQSSIPISYVVIEASSFLYMTPVRYMGSGKGFTPLDETALCTDYNAWPYGLGMLNNYARQTGSNAAKLRYPTRQITYMNGALSAGNAVGDTSCSAMVQGGTSWARVKNFASYIRKIYGLESEARHQFVTIPKVGYDLAALLGSGCGMKLLFGDGKCPAQFEADFSDSENHAPR